MATIKEVASKSGVSVATVSRYINKKGYVGKETGTRIQKTIDELDYTPNEVARSLFQKKSKLIGLLIPDIANPFFPLLAKGVEDELKKAGYTLLLGNIGESSSVAKEYLDTFKRNNVSGVISTAPIEEGYSIPYILLDREWEEEKNTIVADHYMGGQLIANEILKTSYNKIVIVVGPKDVKNTNLRLAGITDIFDSKGVVYDLMPTTTFDFSKADETAKSFFDHYSMYDTVIASNDIYGLAIIREAQRHGLRIPEDIQIIGYDGIPFVEMVNPKLSTIVQPAYEMGRLAAEKLLLRIANNSVELDKIVLPVYFSENETLRY